MAKRLNKKDKKVEKEQVISLPEIFIGATAYNKMKVFIDAATGEISGLGYVKNVGNKFYIDDIVLLKQECSTATTDLDPDALSEYFTECIENGVDTSTLKLWWHSHAHMGVFWSSTDENTIQTLNDEWMISIVSNKRGEILARLDIYKPLRVTLNNLPVKIYYPYDVALEKSWRDEVKEKVKSFYPAAYTYGTKAASGGYVSKHKKSSTEEALDEYFKGKNFKKFNYDEEDDRYWKGEQ